MTSIKPAYPDRFAHTHPIIVRYADLDPQQHVNNAAVVTYLESARMGYYQACGLWDGRSFERFGMVVAALHVDYLKPILFGQAVRVGLSVVHMGNKSLRFQFRVFEHGSDAIFARGQIVMVAYDPTVGRSIPIPQDWRSKITQFEQFGEEHETADH